MAFGEKQNIVGKHFENLGHWLLGGELVRNEDGDICLDDHDTTVEVKSSCYESSYGFRLKVEQIDEYKKLSRFRFERAWYAFFAYRNRRLRRGEVGDPTTELARHTSPAEVERYLAETLQWCLIVDLSVVERWKELLPHSTKSVPGHPGMETVDVKCEDVYPLANGGLYQGLKGLKLPTVEFGVLSGTIDGTMEADLYREYRVKFPLTFVLPYQDMRWVQGMLRERGFPLRYSAIREKAQLTFAT